jgi:heterotetrameric sarcosine oxidase gamma subunit
VPELIAKGPFDGVEPLVMAGLTLAPVEDGPIWSIALLPGGAKAAAKALKPLGLAFPGPGGISEKAGLRLVWTGRDQAFLFGDLPAGLEGAAVVTDQSGGWAGVTLTGPGAARALGRLVAVDVRLAAFPVGGVVRTGLNHMSAVILRTGEDAFEIRVFRSMARTCWHELAEVLRHLGARAPLSA